MPASWRIRAQVRVYLLAIVFGALVGIFILYPANEFVYFKEYGPVGVATSTQTAGDFVFEQMKHSMSGQTPRKTMFYAIVGVVLSLSGSALFTKMQHRLEEIQRLQSALAGDLSRLIAQGEGANVEFKSTFRWDLREDKLNRLLEGAVLKTMAGYMNGEGGTLLIGVADDGAIVGLQHDYATLKKPDRDGFEQALMTAVANKLGTDACRNLHLVFHAHESKEVCRVLVTPAHRPVYLKEGENPKLYVRTGTSTRELNVQEAISYTSARWRG